jgi:ATP-dependent HslUV protease ATP-binding subunit HslU
VRARALDAAEERILDILVPPPRREQHHPCVEAPENTARQVFRKKLREGLLDEREIELDLAESRQALEIMGPAGMEEMTEQLRGMFGQMGGQKRQTRKLRIDEALKLVQDEEAAKLVNEDDIKTQALHAAEQNGIVFIDEIDKVTSRSEAVRRGVAPGRAARPAAAGRGHHRVHQIRHDPHRPHPVHRVRRFPSEQAQRPDPGTAGAFPIRVELQSLSVQDFESILTQTHASLVKQYQALLATEEVTLVFEPSGVTRLAQIAFEVNERTENIGARRLSTVMERLLDEVSFDAAHLAGRPSRSTRPMSTAGWAS